MKTHPLCPALLSSDGSLWDPEEGELERHYRRTGLGPDFPGGSALR